MFMYLYRWLPTKMTMSQKVKILALELGKCQMFYLELPMSMNFRIMLIFLGLKSLMSILLVIRWPLFA